MASLIPAEEEKQYWPIANSQFWLNVMEQYAIEYT
jgi:hypothetical protein